MDHGQFGTRGVHAAITVGLVCRQEQEPVHSQLQEMVAITVLDHR